MALKGSAFRKLKEYQAKRRAQKEEERRVYEESYKKAIESKRLGAIRREARMRAGVKRKWKKEDYWKKRYEKERKKKVKIKPRKDVGYLDVGKSVPSVPVAERGESFASLMDTGRGMSLTDFPSEGRSLMEGFEEKKKKRKGFSIADW